MGGLAFFQNVLLQYCNSLVGQRELSFKELLGYDGVFGHYQLITEASKLNAMINLQIKFLTADNFYTCFLQVHIIFFIQLTLRTGLNQLIEFVKSTDQ